MKRPISWKFGASLIMGLALSLLSLAAVSAGSVTAPTGGTVVKNDLPYGARSGLAQARPGQARDQPYMMNRSPVRLPKTFPR